MHAASSRIWRCPGKHGTEHALAKRCRDAFVDRDGYALFGITQGSTIDLREKAEILKDLDFPGYAIGGLAVGEGQELMFSVLDFHTRHLPVDKPRYLMGVGTTTWWGPKRGVDMFDCVLPTRSGRTGRAFTRFGQLNMRNACTKHRWNRSTQLVTVPVPSIRAAISSICFNTKCWVRCF